MPLASPWKKSEGAKFITKGSTADAEQLPISATNSKNVRDALGIVLTHNGDLGAPWQDMSLWQPSLWSCDRGDGLLWARWWELSGKDAGNSLEHPCSPSVLHSCWCFLEYFVGPAPAESALCRAKPSVMRSKAYGALLGSNTTLTFGYLCPLKILGLLIFSLWVALMVQPKWVCDILCALNPHYCFTRRYCSISMSMDNILFN